MKVHFMGIAGSGVAPIALIAKSMGYEVSRCDISDSTYYSNALKHIRNIFSSCIYDSVQQSF